MLNYVSSIICKKNINKRSLSSVKSKSRGKESLEKNITSIHREKENVRAGLQVDPNFKKKR
jgi:hypothetical protein